MSWQDCLLLVSTVRLTGTASAVSEPTVTLQLPVCGHSKLDHSVCEIPVLITTDCGEKEVNELAFSVVSIFLLADPLCLILAFSVFGHAFFFFFNSCQTPQILLILQKKHNYRKNTELRLYPLKSEWSHGKSVGVTAYVCLL